jgi:hypothetical protein
MGCLIIEYLLEQEGDSRASQLTDNLLARFPRSGRLMALKGIVSARQGLNDISHQAFQDAVRLAPLDPAAWLFWFSGNDRSGVVS